MGHRGSRSPHAHCGQPRRNITRCSSGALRTRRRPALYSTSCLRQPTLCIRDARKQSRARTRLRWSTDCLNPAGHRTSQGTVRRTKPPCSRRAPSGPARGRGIFRRVSWANVNPDTLSFYRQIASELTQLARARSKRTRVGGVRARFAVSGS